MKIGSKIKSLRRAAGITQEELLERLVTLKNPRSDWERMSQSRISGYETGARMPPIYDLADIADALGVAIIEFFISAEDDSPQARALKLASSLRDHEIEFLENQIRQMRALQKHS